MLTPKKTKYRKWHRFRGQLAGVATAGDTIAFGMYGLKAMGRGEITSRQIEAARRAINRCIKRGGKIWIRVFPHKPLTKKAAEVPMGAGKGSVELYVMPIVPGKMLFEMGGVKEAEAREALRLAGYKLGVETKFVMKGDF